MRKRKVAMVLVTEPNLGGGHQYALEIAECLKDLPDSKYELIAICRNRFWCKWCRENHINFFLLSVWIRIRSKLQEIADSLYVHAYTIHIRQSWENS